MTFYLMYIASIVARMIITEHTRTLRMMDLMISISGMASTFPPAGMMFLASGEFMVIWITPIFTLSIGFNVKTVKEV